MSIVIQRCVSITDGDSAAFIVPVEEYDGIEFIPIASADKSFVRYIFGNTKQASIPFLDVLKHERTKATLKLGDQTDDAPSLFNNTTKAAALATAKAAKVHCKTMQSLGKLPSTVDVEFPTVGNIQGLKVKCITSLDAKTVLRVELSAPVLIYLKALFTRGDENCEQATKRQKVKRCSKGVCWASARNAWVACRVGEDGSKRYQTFRPKDSGDAAIAEAQESASQWVEHAEG